MPNVPQARRALQLWRRQGGRSGGFCQRLILIGVALIMAWKAPAFCWRPTIEYGEAIAVAALGWRSIRFSAWLPRDDHAHHHHGHDHGPAMPVIIITITFTTTIARGLSVRKLV